MNESCDRTPLKDDEHELINRVKAGENELFSQLLDPHAGRMYALAYSILRNNHDAEEAVQESALKAFTRLGQLRSSSSFKCWLLQITINEARMRKRHARLHPVLSIDEEQKNTQRGPGIVAQLVDHRENPEQALRRREFEAAIDHACGDLAPKYQRILLLRCKEDLTNPEICRTLNLGIPAVKTQLHRARLHLREQLGSVFGGNHSHRYGV
jgi:RNA polymerase sigma-70 factor (ECF subfamily)